MEKIDELMLDVDKEFPVDNEQEDFDENEVNEEDVADDDYQEDVGDEEDVEYDDEEDSVESSEGSSPNAYSSIASVLRDEGALLNITDEDIDNVNDVDGLVDFLKTKISDSITEQNKFIRNALMAGMPSQEIADILQEKQYYDSITREDLENDSLRNIEAVRKGLIVQDLMYKGFPEEKALKFYEKSVKAGDEIDDAIEALESLQQYSTKAIMNIDKRFKDEQKRQRELQQQREYNFRRKILKEEKLFGDFDVTQHQRNSIYSALRERNYSDKQGNKYTAVEAWQATDPDGFEAAMGLMYMLTKGGKDFRGILKEGAKKEIKKARKDLENALRSSSVMDNGKLRMVNNYDSKKDKQSKYIDFDIQLN